MRMLVRSALIAAGLTVVSAGTVSAQMSDTMKFTTTFPFMVGHQTMPAGSYTVKALELDHSCMEISNGHTAVLLLTERDVPKDPPKQDEVIFAKQGDTYVLREIWDASNVTGAEAVEPRPAHAKHADRK
jgi:hypothetical protein